MIYKSSSCESFTNDRLTIEVKARDIRTFNFYPTSNTEKKREIINSTAMIILCSSSSDDRLFVLNFVKCRPIPIILIL